MARSTTTTAAPSLLQRQEPSGIYRVRVQVPHELRPYIGAREIRHTLRTRSLSEAKARSHAVLAAIQARIEVARRQLAAARHEATDVEVEDARDWSLSTAWREWDYATSRGIPAPVEPPPMWVRPFAQTPLAQLLGITTPDGQQKPARGGASFEHLLDAWSKEKGPTLPRKTLLDFGRAVRRLTEAFPDRDAETLTKRDLVAHKDAMLADGLSGKAVANSLAVVRAIFNSGIANSRLDRLDNPASGITINQAIDHSAARLPYSDADARVILTVCEAETTPSRRWLLPVLIYSGARLSEIAGLRRADVADHGGAVGWVIDIRATSARRLKNLGSARSVPVHKALSCRFGSGGGFTEYVQTIDDPEAPLFPDLQPDTFGSRGGTASKRIGRWLRKATGITDPRLTIHSARHRFADVLRDAGVQTALAYQLTGHAGLGVGARYGRGASLLTLRQAIDLLPSVLPVGVE
jgi:integrase